MFDTVVIYIVALLNATLDHTMLYVTEDPSDPYILALMVTIPFFMATRLLCGPIWDRRRWLLYTVQVWVTFSLVFKPDKS